MPIIRPSLSGHPYKPSQNWPDQAHVQWGESGVVLGNDGSYLTAFFEAFPHDGTSDFIRGEGGSIEEAEEAAFSQWQKFFQCKSNGGHAWGRLRRRIVGEKPYTNGGCFCRRCGAFETAMRPIIDLEEWKKPISDQELSSISMGYLWRANFRDDPRKYLRKLYLRARVCGLDIPQSPTPDEIDELRNLSRDEANAAYKSYLSSCERSVSQYLKEKPLEEENESITSPIVGLMSSLATASLKKLRDRDDENASSGS